MADTFFSRQSPSSPTFDARRRPSPGPTRVALSTSRTYSYRSWKKETSSVTPEDEANGFAESRCWACNRLICVVLKKNYTPQLCPGCNRLHPSRLPQRVHSTGEEDEGQRTVASPTSSQPSSPSASLNLSDVSLKYLTNLRVQQGQSGLATNFDAQMDNFYQTELTIRFEHQKQALQTMELLRIEVYRRLWLYSNYYNNLQEEILEKLCYSCYRKYTVTFRRHHCRICKHASCGTCCPKRVPLPRHGGTISFRCCHCCVKSKHTELLRGMLELQDTETVHRTYTVVVPQKLAYQEIDERFVLEIGEATNRARMLCWERLRSQVVETFLRPTYTESYTSQRPFFVCSPSTLSSPPTTCVGTENCLLWDNDDTPASDYHPIQHTALNTATLSPCDHNSTCGVHNTTSVPPHALRSPDLNSELSQVTTEESIIATPTPTTTDVPSMTNNGTPSSQSAHTTIPTVGTPMQGGSTTTDHQTTGTYQYDHIAVVTNHTRGIPKKLPPPITTTNTSPPNSLPTTEDEASCISDDPSTVTTPPSTHPLLAGQQQTPITSSPHRPSNGHTSTMAYPNNTTIRRLSSRNFSSSVQTASPATTPLSCNTTSPHNHSLERCEYNLYGFYKRGDCCMNTVEANIKAMIEGNDNKSTHSDDGTANSCRPSFTEAALQAIRYMSVWKSIFGQDQGLEVTQLCEFLVKGGLPQCMRGAVWREAATRLYGNPLPVGNGEYAEMLDQYICYDEESKSNHLLTDNPKILQMHNTIELDLSRTLVDHCKFSKENSDSVNALYRILIIFAINTPTIGYCQGMSFIAATLLLYYEEEEAFWMLTILFQYYGLLQIYDNQFKGLLAMCDTIKLLLPVPILDRLEEFNISLPVYITPWILTLFTSSFQCWTTVLVLWDLIFLTPPSLCITIRFIVQLHKYFESAILNCTDTITLMQLLQRDLTDKLLHLHVLDDMLIPGILLSPLPHQLPWFQYLSLNGNVSIQHIYEVVVCGGAVTHIDCQGRGATNNNNGVFVVNDHSSFTSSTSPAASLQNSRPSSPYTLSSVSVAGKSPSVKTKAATTSPLLSPTSNSSGTPHSSSDQHSYEDKARFII